MFNTEISKHVIRASAILTGSYVAGTVFSAGESNHLSLLVEYTKGDEDQLDLKVEASDDGTDYGQQVGESSPSSGEVTVSLGSRKFTATGDYLIEVYPFRAKIVKISAKAAGGTPTGTVKVTAFTSWA